MIAPPPSGPIWKFRTLARSGMVAPLRPDKFLRMGAVVAKGVNATTGISLAARRRPHGTALIDERGSLTWSELEARCQALAVGLAGLDRRTAEPIGTIAILCRNHRGFVESLVAASLLGADTLLLNTSFAGPQLADVVEREGVDLLIYDDEFAGVVAAADELAEPPVRIRAWTEERRRVRRAARGRPGARLPRRAARPTASGRAGSCCSPPARPARRRAPAAPAAATSARWSRCWTGSRGRPSARS